MAFSRKLLAAFTLVLVGAGPIACEAVGFYNMPTNLRQCFGVGFGPGYHADLVLGPPWKAGAEGHHIRYVRSAYKPPVPSGFATPSVLGGCHNGACGLEAYMGEPSVAHGGMLGPTAPPVEAHPTVTAPVTTTPYEVVPGPLLMP